VGGIKYESQGGGTIPVTSFADGMINGTGALAGPAYWNVYSIGNGTAGVDVDAQVNPSGVGLVFGSGSGVNNNPTRVSFFPASVDPAAVAAGSLTRGSFAQCTLVSRTAGVDCEVALMTFSAPGTDAGYILQFQSESTNVGLHMGRGSAVVYTIRANVTTLAPGDVLRIETTWAAGANTIRVFKNGALISTDTDVNASRPQGGQNGFGLLGVFTGVVVIKDFSCGLL
jgi:hypothetical protein